MIGTYYYWRHEKEGKIIEENIVKTLDDLIDEIKDEIELMNHGDVIIIHKEE